MKVLTSQAPFAVQPRVFDERFPHFVLYVQDAAAVATQWRGVFLASTRSRFNDGVLRLPLRETRKSSAKMKAIAWNCILARQYAPVRRRFPDRYNVTTFGENDLAVDISGTPHRPKTLVECFRTVRFGLLSDHGPTWRDSRVELNNRLAFPVACLVFALLGVSIGVRPAAVDAPRD